MVYLTAPQVLCIHKSDFWQQNPEVEADIWPLSRSRVYTDRMKASDKAYAALRRDIVAWALPPGTVLGEVEQAERLGVSRTPLREALSRLTADGLAVAQRGRGVVVSDVSLDHVDDLFALRRALETEAARGAALAGRPGPFQELAQRFDDASQALASAIERTDYYQLAGELINLLARSGQAPETAEDVVSQAADGSSAVLRVVDDAGMAVGQELGNIANLLNPEVIVVGGPLAGLGDLLLDPIRRGLLRHAVPVVGESTALVMSSLGDRAEALGAAALAFQHVGIRAP